MGKRYLIRSSEGNKRRAWLIREASLLSVSGSPERKFVLQFVRLLKKKGVITELLIIIIQWYQQVARFSSLMSYDLCIEKGGARVWQGCRTRIASDMYQAAIEPAVPYNWNSKLIVKLSNSKKKSVQRDDLLRVGVVNLPESTSDAAGLFDGQVFPDSLFSKELQIKNVTSSDIITITSSPTIKQISVLVLHENGKSTVHYFHHSFKPFSSYNLFGRLAHLGEGIDIIGFSMSPPNLSIASRGSISLIVFCVVCVVWGMSSVGYKIINTQPVVTSNN